MNSKVIRDALTNPTAFELHPHQTMMVKSIESLRFGRVVAATSGKASTHRDIPEYLSIQPVKLDNYLNELQSKSRADRDDGVVIFQDIDQLTTVAAKRLVDLIQDSAKHVEAKFPYRHIGQAMIDRFYADDIVIINQAYTQVNTTVPAGSNTAIYVDAVERLRTRVRKGAFKSVVVRKRNNEAV